MYLTRLNGEELLLLGWKAGRERLWHSPATHIVGLVGLAAQKSVKECSCAFNFPVTLPPEGAGTLRGCREGQS